MIEQILDIPEGYKTASVTATDKQIVILFEKQDNRIVVKGFK